MHISESLHRSLDGGKPYVITNRKESNVIANQKESDVIANQ